MLEDENFFNFKISVKSSDVFLSIEAYRQLSKLTDYPLHLGITEAGSFLPGSIKSSIGFGALLLNGIGDNLMDKYFISNPYIQTSNAVWATIILIFFGALAGYLPARKAAKIKPIIALRDK